MNILNERNKIYLKKAGKEEYILNERKNIYIMKERMYIYIEWPV